MNIRDIAGMARVIPELTVTDIAHALPLARAAARDYLSLPNVTCVSGSWLVPQGMIEAEDWPGIAALARDAASLAKS